MDRDKIQMLSGVVQTEEVAGRRKFTLPLEEPVKEYEKRMLCDTDCPCVLPMKFLMEDGKERIFYDMTGFLPLPDYIERITAENRSVRASQKLVCSMLDILTGILACIKGMEDYLIDPERISIHPDVIFIHSESGKVRMAFYPNEAKEAFLQERIFQVMEDLDRLFENADVNQYLMNFKDFIRQKNPGLDGMIASLGKLQREAGYIYWNSEEFRKEEKEESVEYEKSLNGQLKTGRFKIPERVKPIAIQLGFITALTAFYLSGIMDLMSFAGLAVITAGADLWIMRKLRYI